MKTQEIRNHRSWIAAVAVLALAATLATGCKKTQPAAPTDQQVTSSIQSKIQGESALSGQNIQVSVANGVATLNGTVSDDASRSLAGNDAGSVDGVRTVVNNLMVQPAQPAAAPAKASAPAPAQEQAPAPARERRSRRAYQNAQDANLPPAQPEPAPSQPAQQPMQAQAPPPPPRPAAPPQPVVRQIVIPSGTQIPIRLVDALDTKTAQPDDVFHASVARDVMVNGVVAIPQGSPVLGRVVEVHEAAHFKGSAMLAIQLTQIASRGQKIPIDTDTYSQEGKARGKNTAEKAGGGALLGALVGAIAGGGKGAAIGAAAGGGAGAGINAITRGEQIKLPSETPLDFRLQTPATVTVTILPSGKVENNQGNQPQLQHR